MPDSESRHGGLSRSTKLVPHAARDTLKNLTKQVQFIGLVSWNSCMKSDVPGSLSLKSCKTL